MAKRIVDYIDNNAVNYDEVFFTMDTHDQNYLNTREGKFLPAEHCIIDTEGWQLNIEITEAIVRNKLLQKENFIMKDTFGSLKLMKLIEDHDKFNEELTIDFCGFDSDICILNNALIARNYFPEANIRVFANLCQGSSPTGHQAALNVMKTNHIIVEEEE